MWPSASTAPAYFSLRICSSLIAICLALIPFALGHGATTRPLDQRILARSHSHPTSDKGIKSNFAKLVFHRDQSAAPTKSGLARLTVANLSWLKMRFAQETERTGGSIESQWQPGVCGSL